MNAATAVATKAPAFPIPELTDGEEYIGAIVGADGRGHHTILLPGDEKANWKKGMALAESKGASLPNRIEQAMLFAHHRDKFKPDVYWTCEQYEAFGVYAWAQSFDGGTQDDCHRVNEFRVRLVRRVPI